MAAVPVPASESTSSAAPDPTAIVFPDGIPGFEGCRRFVLLSSQDFAPLQRIDAVDGPRASFLCIDPRRVLADYACTLSPADAGVLDADDTTRLVWLAIVTVERDGTVVANLRAPIVINADRMIGRQVLPNASTYAIRHVLAPGEP